MSDGGDLVNALEDLVDTPDYHGKNRRVTQEAYNGRDRRGPRGDGALKLVRVAVAAVLTAGAVMVAVSQLDPYLPVTNASAQDAQAAVDGRFARIEPQLKANTEEIAILKRDVGDMKATAEKSLNLQLRQAVRSIEDDMRATAAGAAGRRNLERLRDQTCIELAESNAKLNYQNQGCR